MLNIPNKVDLTTTLPANSFNSHKNELQDLVTSAGETLDINIADQLRKAVSSYSRALICNDSGVANAYVLSRANSSLIDSASLYDGMTIAFKTTNANTGASTVNFNSLGVKNIVVNNVAIAAGDIDTDLFHILEYNTTNDNFELSSLATKKYVDDNTATTQEVLIVHDQKPNGTNAGNSTANTFITRDLNTILKNSITGASLSSNQITLPIGDYEVIAFVSAGEAGVQKTRLRNITDSSSDIIGQTIRCGGGSNVATVNVFDAPLSITGSSKVFEIQHYNQSTVAGNGLGQAASSGEVEVYSQIRITKVG